VTDLAAFDLALSMFCNILYKGCSSMLIAMRPSCAASSSFVMRVEGRCDFGVLHLNVIL